MTKGQGSTQGKILTLSYSWKRNLLTVDKLKGERKVALFCRWGCSFILLAWFRYLGQLVLLRVKRLYKSVQSSSDWSPLYYNETFLCWWEWPTPGWPHPPSTGLTEGFDEDDNSVNHMLYVRFTLSKPQPKWTLLGDFRVTSPASLCRICAKIYWRLVLAQHVTM